MTFVVTLYDTHGHRYWRHSINCIIMTSYLGSIVTTLLPCIVIIIEMLVLGGPQNGLYLKVYNSCVCVCVCIKTQKNYPYIKLFSTLFAVRLVLFL